MYGVDVVDGFSKAGRKEEGVDKGCEAFRISGQGMCDG